MDEGEDEDGGDMEDWAKAGVAVRRAAAASSTCVFMGHPSC
jgi:hypothetical protein